MPTVFSNSPVAKDWVRKPFEHLAQSSSQLWLASPYFTEADAVVEAAKAGKSVQLLIGLNLATKPDALRQVQGFPGVSIRFYTDRFHAKLFIFEQGALIGSSNLTDGGMAANREGTMLLDPLDDRERYEEIQALFSDLWEGGNVLTDPILNTFAATWKRLNDGPDPHLQLEKQIGRHAPPNIAVASQTSSTSRNFLQGLRREVYEQYRPAFLEVDQVLTEENLRRDDLISIAPLQETNRFLNWLRKTHVVGEDAWRSAPLREPADRRELVRQYGREWVQATDNLVPDVFFDWLDTVSRYFGSLEAIQTATHDEIGNALMSLHAFTEQLRFVKGGQKNVLPEFWRENRDDTELVRRSISHLLHGHGDFAERLHDVLFDRSRKIRMFGKFTALELFGTVRPEEFPPVNGRMVKGLRFLGHPVQ